MEFRRDQRHVLPEGINKDSGYEIIFELNGKNFITGMADNISMIGMGVKIVDISRPQIDEINKSNGFFVRILHSDQTIVVGVKNIWNSVTQVDKNSVYRCGLKFDLISPEDKLKLACLVETLRDLE